MSMNVEEMEYDPSGIERRSRGRKRSSMPGRSRVRKDVAYAMEMNQWFLKAIGIWPSIGGIVEKIVVDGQKAACYLLICFLLIPSGLETFLGKHTDPRMRLKMIGPLSFCTMALTKYCFLIVRRGEILNCLEHIANDWLTVRSSSDRRIMYNEAKFGRFLASLCAAFMYGGGFFYHTIMPLSQSGGVTTQAFTERNLSLRVLAYPVYSSLFDTQSSPAYEIIFVTQCLSGFVLYTITVGACSMAAAFAMHACGQFTILVKRLDELVDGSDRLSKSDAALDERMAEIVELHLRTLGFVTRIEAIMNEVCLIEFIGCTINICLLGHYFITEWEQSAAINTLTYCVLLVSFTFNIFIFCYIGEMLAEQSKRIGMVTYMIDWYRLPGTRARSLIFILVVSRNPASITAGKMAELSLASFSNVLKTALTYLNLLRTVAN